MKHHTARARLAVTACAVFGLTYCIVAQATDVATRPLRGSLLVEPNVVIAFDDSGSMDAETLLDTNDAALWWNADTGSGWETRNGQNRAADSSDGANMHTYRKLFPQLGVSLGAGIENGATLSRAAPPIWQLAWLRSASFNRLYYDPTVTYKPWDDAIEPGRATVTTYAAANPTSAKTHPSDSLTPLTINLTATQAASSAAWRTFRFMPGMRFPANAVRADNGNALTAGIASTGQLDVAMPYFAATFWHFEACTIETGTDPGCVAAPDGSGTLKRYEIRNTAGITFPGPHTSHAAQMQNFANWWQYHRKRKLLAAAAMGRLISGLGDGLRLGNAYLNVTGARPDITMESTSSGGAGMRQRLAGLYYNRSILGGAPTPTLATLAHIGNQYDSNTALVQHSCQRNNAFIVTDGYPTDSTTVPAYDRSTYGAAAPHATTHANTLADVALHRYTTRLRAGGAVPLSAGNVPTGDAGRPNADLNSDLHMNTYAVTLGARGLLWPAADANDDNLPDATLNWPANPQRRQQLDDLWHATINGRGQMLLANNTQDLTAAVGRVLFDIASVQGAQGAAAFSSVNLSANEFALLASYNAGRWNGDLSRRAVNAATGTIAPVDVWSAAQQLDDGTVQERVLFTRNGPFDAATVGALVNPGGLLGSNTPAIVDYLRGERGNEGFAGGQFRPRRSRLGAVSGSVPAMNAARSVAFVAASDGFLHAVNVSSGKELWAYAPQAVLTGMGLSSQLNWGFKALHDGSAVVARVGAAEMLFGNLGAGGKAWYGLDITQAATALDATTRAASVTWELPGNDTALQQRMGLSVGRPLVVKTSAYGDVVLLSSGYNAPITDGRGRIFVVRLTDGVVLATLETPVVAAGIDPGLAQLSAFRDVDGTVRYVYGGDERGNLWRFDLVANSVLRVAALTDANNNAQAITMRPALVEFEGKRIVLVGSGRLLGSSDLAPESRGNSFYAIWDNDSELLAPRATLVRQPLVASADGTRRIDPALPVSFAAQRGWYIDLPADERAHITPLVGISAVAFVSNQPQRDLCTMASYRYALDIARGAAIDDPAHNGGLVGSVVTETTQGAAGNNIIVTSGTPVSGGAGGTVKHCLRGLDGSVACVDLEKNTANQPKKSGWRRVVR
jgi:type IV pilus assembly protein PilY1